MFPAFVYQHFLVRPYWYIPCNHIINNICIGVGVDDLQQHVVPVVVVYRYVLRVSNMHLRQVVYDRVFYSLFIFYFNIKFLE
jgi:hypothetical protein